MTGQPGGGEMPGQPGGGDLPGRAEGTGGGHHTPVRLTAWVEGLVQGVGFRWWVRSRARRLGLSGFVANLPDGRVQVIAEGARAACQELLDLLSQPDTPGRVTAVCPQWGQADGEFSGFSAR